jgi:hypothetical protein
MTATAIVTAASAAAAQAAARAFFETSLNALSLLLLLTSHREDFGQFGS